MSQELARPPGRAESRRERVHQLMGWCEERLSTHPDDIRSLMDIAQALWDMGQRKGAVEYLKKVLTHHPGHPQVREAIQRYSAEIGARGLFQGRVGDRP